MASVEQAKDAVEAEHQRAAEMTAKALSAIDSVVALSSFTLTAIGIVVGAVALIGGVVIYIGAREMARKVATRRLEAYIKSDEGTAFIRRAIAEDVRQQFEQRIVMVVQPGGGAAQPPAGQFPPPPPQAGGQP